MSEEERSNQFMEAVSQGAATGIEALAVGMGSLIEGMGELFDAVQSSPVLNDMANHGRSEMAAAMFNGDPYVMYQKGSHDQPSPEVQEPEIEQSRGM